MNHPYERAPDHAFWRRAVTDVPSECVDPAVGFPRLLSADTRVMTAGSCFAQHISRRLVEQKFNFLVTEPAHPILDAATAEAFGYGVFSARYGNIYTSRQFLQLIRRSFGQFDPVDKVWEDEGRFFDPYRPAVQPGGFVSRAEFEADQRQHLSAVRTAIETLEVLIFTLGLTEVWINREDGAAYPLCPGVSGGRFDADRHALANLTVDDVVSEMSEAISQIRAVNPKAKVILSVSPVPLVATAEDRHVLVSTTLSKSVLRVSADVLTRSLEDVFYFPSYEIITGAFSRGAYFAEDLRSVRESGVDHVMRLFFRHAAGAQLELQPRHTRKQLRRISRERGLSEAERVIAVLCEEQLLEPLKNEEA